MQSQPGGLVVRQAERHRCDISARLVIDVTHADKVVLSKSARSADGSVAATIIDCSLGGLGMRSRVFIPKGCRLLVVCTGEEAASHGFDGEFVVRVQRAIMLDREPNYMIGTLHLRDASEDEVDAGPPARVKRLIEYAKSAWGQESGAGEVGRA